MQRLDPSLQQYRLVISYCPEAGTYRFKASLLEKKNYNQGECPPCDTVIRFGCPGGARPGKVGPGRVGSEIEALLSERRPAPFRILS